MFNRKIKKQINEKLDQIAKNVSIFRESESSFKKETNKLVNDVIDLSKTIKPNYDFSDLIKEKKLIGCVDILERYIAYDVSPEVNKLYFDNKLSNIDLMALGNLKTDFKEPSKMNKIIKGLLSGVITGKQLLLASKLEVCDMIGDKNEEMKEANRILLECVHNIKGVSNQIHKWNGKFRKLLTPELKERMVENYRELGIILTKELKIQL